MYLQQFESDLEDPRDQPGTSKIMTSPLSQQSIPCLFKEPLLAELCHQQTEQALQAQSDLIKLSEMA